MNKAMTDMEMGRGRKGLEGMEMKPTKPKSDLRVITVHLEPVLLPARSCSADRREMFSIVDTRAAELAAARAQLPGFAEDVASLTAAAARRLMPPPVKPAYTSLVDRCPEPEPDWSRSLPRTQPAATAPHGKPVCYAPGKPWKMAAAADLPEDDRRADPLAWLEEPFPAAGADDDDATPAAPRPHTPHTPHPPPPLPAVSWERTLRARAGSPRDIRTARLNRGRSGGAFSSSSPRQQHRQSCGIALGSSSPWTGTRDRGSTGGSSSFSSSGKRPLSSKPRPKPAFVAVGLSQRPQCAQSSGDSQRTLSLTSPRGR